jgi:hypothetical protein
MGHRIGERAVFVFGDRVEHQAKRAGGVRLTANRHEWTRIFGEEKRGGRVGGFFNHGWTRMDTDGREFWEGKNEEDEWADFLTTAEHG